MNINEWRVSIKHYRPHKRLPHLFGGFRAGKMSDRHKSIMYSHNDAEHRADDDQQSRDLEVVGKIAKAYHPPQNAHRDTAGGEEGGYLQKLIGKASWFIFASLKNNWFKTVIFPGD